MHISYGQYLHTLLRHGTVLDLASVFLLYPIAGFAIYSVKNWSYPVYLAVMASTFYFNFQDWRHYPGVFTLPIFLGTLFLNIALVSYFLLPAVRTTYFNRRLRWWESKPRYEVHIPAILEAPSQDGKAHGKHLKCTVSNLSEGGAFVNCRKNLEVGTVVQLHFSIFDRPVTADAKICHRRWQGVRGYGLEFQHSPDSRVQLQRIAKGLRLIGIQTRAAEGNWGESLTRWAATLFKTGKGLVPEIPEKADPERGMLKLVKGGAATREVGQTETDQEHDDEDESAKAA